MKKFIAILLAAVLLIPGINSFANVASVQKPNEKEVIRLKKMFGITNDYKNFSFSTSESEEDIEPYKSKAFKTLSYFWYSDDKSVNIRTDKDGNIIDYYKYDDTKKGDSKFIEKKEVELLAETFLKNLGNDISKSYKLKNSKIYLKSGHAELDYTRFVNKTEVLNDTINIQIDLKTREVNSYSRTYSSETFKDNSFPKKEKIISKEDSIKLQEDNNPVKLFYIVYKDENVEKSEMVYGQLKPFKPVDAIKASFVTDNIYHLGNNVFDSVAAAEEKTKGEAQGLSDVEISEFEKIKGIKDFSEVEKIIKANFNIKGYKQSLKRLSKSDERYIYSVEYSKDGKKYIQFAFDAKELVLMNYYYSDSSWKGNKKLDETVAIKLATDFANKFNTKKNIDFKNPIISDSDGETKVNFLRIENSIPVYRNGIQIVINNSSREISSYNFKFDDCKFEKSTPKINLEEAKKIFFDSFEYNLYYVYVGAVPKLMYMFDNYNTPIVRASDGKIVNTDGTVIESEKFEYENINSSKYAEEINYLTSMDIGIPGIKDLKSQITVEDFMLLLNLISGRGDYFDEISKSSLSFFEGADQDMLDKKIQTKYAVRWILNNEGYRDLTKLKDVFDKKIFKDSASIPSEFKAYYYLGYALSIYDFDEAMPNSYITAEEALHLAYNIVK
ncbi:YcdB/YcdC domain-containing protein [Peptoniphilus mikwangii]|uniref:YcdB/YcdC domain-containing protein n=1 Tax=Peptoniphilus mikwangii TaxID=1354300 RepID=UPI0004168006|nr:YcdB/YcdC domain-containing protein [Peptoniphilus mikwangii]